MLHTLIQIFVKGMGGGGGSRDTFVCQRVGGGSLLNAFNDFEFEREEGFGSH